MNPDWLRNCDPEQMRINLEYSHDEGDRLRAENARLRAAIGLAITHLEGQATKLSEREPIVVLQQLRAALVTNPTAGGWGR